MPKVNILILGLGMQGKAALYDLYHSVDFNRITVADANPETAETLKAYSDDRISWMKIDVRDEKQLLDLIKDSNIVIEALPSQFVLTVGMLAALHGVHLVSSMYYLNPGVSEPDEVAAVKKKIGEIDLLAKKNSCTILTEFGLDPGLDLVIGKQSISEMDEVVEFHSYGAGIPPKEFCNNPLDYKFSWSVMGVLNAYVRPSKVIAGGETVETDALSMFAPEIMHILDLAEIGGEVECFPNGDAVKYAEQFDILGSVKEMGRYSCRWPGHREFWEKMVKCGFLSNVPVNVGDVSVVPIKFLAALLQSQEQFFYAENERDLSFIRTDVKGVCKGKRVRVVYQIIDERDLETGFTSMQRGVGFTMSIGAQLILDGRISRKGLVYPMDVPLQTIAPELEKRDIKLTRQELDW